MKKSISIVVCLLLLSLSLQAQTGTSAPKTGQSHEVSFLIHAPVGVFARTQFAGAGLNYTWSHRRFGMDAVAKRKIGLTFAAGADYYFGKKIKPAGYSFRHDGYLYSYVLTGIMINPRHSILSLTAGPGLGIYKGNSDIGLTVNLWGAYYLNDCISIGPGVTYKKHAETDELWTAAVKVSYCF